jgi:hypothetical protein
MSRPAAPPNAARGPTRQLGGARLTASLFAAFLLTRCSKSRAGGLATALSLAPRAPAAAPTTRLCPHSPRLPAAPCPGVEDTAARGGARAPQEVRGLHGRHVWGLRAARGRWGGSWFRGLAEGVGFGLQGLGHRFRLPDLIMNLEEREAGDHGVALVGLRATLQCRCAKTRSGDDEASSGWERGRSQRADRAAVCNDWRGAAPARGFL